jgi:glucose/arabinose dehydrogenase
MSSRFIRLSFLLPLGLLAASCGGDFFSNGSSDTQPPLAVIQQPAVLSKNLTGPVSLAAQASDNVGVTAVDFMVDGAVIQTVTAAPYTAAITSSRWAAGQHVVRARAHDAAGNVSPLLGSFSTVQFGGTQAFPAGFTLKEDWVTGLASPTAIAQTPDGRLLVAQQGGTVMVVKNAALLSTPFLTLPPANIDTTNERGLNGIAVHPQFATNGWVYLYYTFKDNTGPHNLVTRFTANGDVVTPGTEQLIIDLKNLAGTHHNGGGLHFGPDGKLYIGVGDDETPANASSTTSVFGKLLRLNDDGTVPADNPFVSTRTGGAQAVWADGLQNPATFAFDPASGTLYVNDQGQTWQEIDLGAAGANYGWPAVEGPTGNGTGITAPSFVYNSAADTPGGPIESRFFVGTRIAGGAFYPATGPFPAEYRGTYFFGDVTGKFIGRLDVANSAAYTFVNLTNSPIDMLVGNQDGFLYVVTPTAIARVTAP